MSDSENDLLSNPFHYQSDITVVSAKGPNINTRNMSFRNNFSSTLQLPRTFEPRYAESCYDPRSGYSRREPSPMSVTSACNTRYQNFNSSQYRRGMSSQRSVYNGRSGSPMSVRTIDSQASVSATDIAMALKHVKFNKYDMRIIKEAFNSLMKKRNRKKIEKRRNLKLFLKGNRRRSGYDSGEQASDSSLSSDDGRSVRTGFEENMSSCRSTKTDIVEEIRKTIREGNIYKDCTENFRQNSFRKLVNGSSLNNTQASTSSMRNIPSHSFHAPRLKNTSTMQSLPSFQTQGERFQNGFVLPSQRFNKSVMPPPIPEIRIRNDDTDSDYDLFSTDKNKTSADNRKRNIEDTSVLPNTKRLKVLSPCKNSAEANKATKEVINNNLHENSNDFEFVKPMMPVKKFKEKLISKSGPIPDIVEPPKNQQTIENNNQNPISKETIDLDKETDITNMTQNSTDVSMRPSFIKRKLFTQKLDFAENKNLSSDKLNSPQNSIYSAIQKEKHKTRKLVSNQSCLSRDIGQDENNLLDLIHKIVPANTMNTTQSNRTRVQSKSNESDKFDVTSIITAKNDGEDVSDTFTDEEIFNGKNNTVKETLIEKPKQSSAKKTKTVEKTQNINKVKSTPVKEQSKETVGSNERLKRDCRVNVEKIPITKLPMTSDKNGVNKTKCWSTFWDIDSESDIESINTKRNKFKDNNESISEQVKKTSITKSIGAIFQKPPSILNASTMTTAFETTQRLNVTGFKIRSHRSPKLKKCCDEIKENTIKSYFETSIRKQNDTIRIDYNKPDASITQKNDTVKNIKDAKTTGNIKKAKKSPQKEKPNNKQKINSEANNVSLTEKKKQKETKAKPSQQKVKEVKKTPQKRERKPKAVTEKEKQTTPQKNKQITPLKNKQNTPEKNKLNTGEKVKDTKNKKINNNEGKPKNGQLKTLINDNSKENQVPNKKQSNSKKSKKIDNVKNNKNTKKILLDSSVTNSTMENNNSKIQRAIRSCRLSKQNSTINSSKDSFNLTMTLRSGNVDMSKSINNLRTKLKDITRIK